LRAICSGAAKLGSGWVKRRRAKEWEREYEKKPRAIEVEGAEEIPPPPEGPAPTWNNHVFANGGRGAPTEDETRAQRLERAESGGFKTKGASVTEYLRGFVRARVCRRSER